MSSWGDYPGFFDWGPAKEVEGGLVARRATGRSDPGDRSVGSVLLERLTARASSGVIQRGRSYARKGQTVALAIEPGLVRASVQGAADDPYTITLRCAARPAARSALIEVLGRLVVRPDVELPAHGSAAVNVDLAALDLLRGATVTAECTCPFGAVCKHAVAVAILAGERLDESPKTLATFFDVTEAAFAAGATRDPAVGGPVTEAATATARFDARRQARLAAKLRRLDTAERPDREAVLIAAVAVVPAPPSVRQALDLPAGD
jgi:uncharacterized Zn finger protein